MAILTYATKERPLTLPWPLTDGLCAFVQCQASWGYETIAAFNDPGVAEAYCNDCERDNPTYIYRVVLTGEEQ